MSSNKCMPLSKNKRLKKAPGYAEMYFSRGATFDISDYLHNTSMIMQLHKDNETAYFYLNTLEKLLEDKVSIETELTLEFKEINIRLEEKCNINKKLEQETQSLGSSLRESNRRIEKMLQETYRLRMKLALTEGKLEDSSRSSSLQFMISMIATVLLGFGVNVVTTTPGNWVAWILVITSIILSIFAFMSIRKSD